MDCVEDVVEILARRTFALRELVGEVLGHLLILGELWPERLNGQLLIMRHLDDGDVCLLEELLLVGEDLLEEVIVDGIGWWQVELDYIVKHKS